VETGSTAAVSTAAVSEEVATTEVATTEVATTEVAAEEEPLCNRLLEEQHVPPQRQLLRRLCLTTTAAAAETRTHKGNARERDRMEAAQRRSQRRSQGNPREPITEVVQGVIQPRQQGNVEARITEAVRGVMRFPHQDLPTEPITEVVQEVILHLPVSTAMTNRTHNGDACSVAVADGSSNVWGLSCWQFCGADPAEEEAWTILQLLLPQPIVIAIAIASPFALLVGV